MDNIMTNVEQIMTEIANFALSNLPDIDARSVATKRDAADFVSNRDYAMEQFIVDTIHRYFPDHSIQSEEVGRVGGNSSPHEWFVDPIDGSCNDSHEVPWSSVSVAYAHNEQMMAGIVVHPHTGEVFKAFRGMGAFMEYLAGRDATTRIMGSTALAIVQVAAGRAAAVVLDDAGLLDIAAGILIAQEAGAVVLEDGQPLIALPSGKLVVAWPGVLLDIEAGIGALQADS